MPSFRVDTPQRSYDAIVERGVLGRVAEYLPLRAGKLFVVSSEDVWRHQGARMTDALSGVAHEVLFLPGGEDQKRLAPLEEAAEEMVRRGGDRSSVVVAFGGGIVTDMAGFLAAIFMRGIPVMQVPTTLLAQVDAAHRRQDRREPGDRQEPDRQLSSAAGGADRSDRSGHAAGARISRRAVRNHQGRRDSQRAAVRISDGASRRCAGAEAGGARPHHRGIGADQGRSGVGGRARGRICGAS